MTTPNQFSQTSETEETISLLDALDKIAFGRARNQQESNKFPPFNILYPDNKDQSIMLIEMAVAGYGKDDINIFLRKENGKSILVIKGKIEKDPEVETKKTYIQRGLSARDFIREFTLGNLVEVQGVKLKDGILSIELKTRKVEDESFKIEIQ